MMCECDPKTCPVGANCQNRRLQKRLYAPTTLFKTESRGWGLKAAQDICEVCMVFEYIIAGSADILSRHQGDLVVEYVGEIIDQAECRRRLLYQEKVGCAFNS